MKERTLYAAVGHTCWKIDERGNGYPAVILNRKEYVLDIQELAVWTALYWNIADFDELEVKYHQLMKNESFQPRSLECCIERLKTRGLVASGTGRTDFEALYDLLGGLFIIPVARNMPLRVLASVMLVLSGSASADKARTLFQKDNRSEQEAQVMALSKQALLSTAELIKCADCGVTDVSTDEKLLDALYSDADSNSDNLPFLMRGTKQQIPVTMAVANLYLRKQIVLERV